MNLNKIRIVSQMATEKELQILSIGFNSLTILIEIEFEESLKINNSIQNRFSK